MVDEDTIDETATEAPQEPPPEPEASLAPSAEAPREAVSLDIPMMGFKVKDRSTGLKGFIVAVEHHISGTIHYVVQPKARGSFVPVSVGVDIDILKVLGPGISKYKGEMDRCALLLGQRVEDRISKTRGIIAKLIYQFSGCIHAVIICEDGPGSKIYCTDHKRFRVVDEGYSTNSEDPLVMARTGCIFRGDEGVIHI
jgi:hypothetical protein